MALWAIIPVKPLRRGKSRLAGVLTEDERTDLNRRLLSHTLDTLTPIPEIENVLVISRDASVLGLARVYGARTVQENGSPELNLALTRATSVARGFAASGVMILPADLPLVSVEDIRGLLACALNPPVVVIAPDHRHEGTNALIVSPAGLIEYFFGVNSFQLHCDAARRAGARLEICEFPGIALDMDLPEDLEKVSETFEVDGDQGTA